MSKGINLLAQTYNFNEDIREWRQQTTNLKTWATFKTLFHQDHGEQRRLVATVGKGGYTAAVHNIHSVLPPLQKENHKTIDNLNTIVQGM